MSDLTRAQKARLGFFLLLAVGLLAVVVVVKVGESLFDTRDVYRVRMPGSVGALDPGSAVTFNGIVVGRVERVAIDPYDVAVVDIDLSLEEGTPIPADAEATVAMAGITGQKYVELTGGTNKARRRRPGEEIPAGRSMLDELQDRAVGIAAKLDGLLDDARAWMYGPSLDHVEATLASVRRTTEALEELLVTNAPQITSLLARGDEVAEDLAGLMVEARATAVSAREALTAGRATLLTLDQTVKRVGDSVARVGDTVERIASKQVEPIVAQLSTAVKRAGSDLRVALDELVQGFDSVGAVADMLSKDPSSLIFGKSGKERKLP